jgi:hypothetical protein
MFMLAKEDGARAIKFDWSMRYSAAAVGASAIFADVCGARGLLPSYVFILSIDNVYLWPMRPELWVIKFDRPLRYSAAAGCASSIFAGLCGARGFLPQQR